MLRRLSSLIALSGAALLLSAIPASAQFSPPQGGLDQTDPVVAKKITNIAALRAIVEAGLTSEDISAALPILKTLQAAEVSAQTQMSTQLDAQRAALLSAKPGALPADSGDPFRALQTDLDAKRQAARTQLLSAVGNDKGQRLADLAGLYAYQAMPGPMMGKPIPGGSGIAGGMMGMPAATGSSASGGPFGAGRTGTGGPGSNPFGAAPGGQGGPAPMMPFSRPHIPVADLVALLQQRMSALSNSQ